MLSTPVRVRHSPAARRRLQAGAVMLVIGQALGGLPARAQVEQVRVNGVPLAILQRPLRGEPAQVAGELQRRWLAAGETGWSFRGSLGSHVVLARQRGPLHESWLIGPGAGPGGSEVIVSVLDTRRPARPVAAPPLSPPPGSQLLSVVEPQGVQGPCSIEFLLVTRQELAGARRSWARALHRAGWLAPSPMAGRCVVARRAAEQLLLCLDPRGPATSVVLQWRRS